MTKDEILKEIGRTTKANGGRVLGERAFFSETGITKTNLWKFWARYSEAVKEVGFNPNEFRDEQHYSDDDLLARYAKLAQDLGRLPTNADLRLKKSQAAEFPNSNTYENRFGLKVELVAKLSGYCDAHTDLADVRNWCQDYLADNRTGITDTDSVDGESGYVYLMKMGRFFKIGHTNNVVRRGREITIQLPEQAVTVHLFRTDDPAGIESYWHRRFAAKRRNGEWFELTGKDVATFKRRRNFM